MGVHTHGVSPWNITSVRPSFLLTDLQVHALEARIALVKPVAVLVGCNCGPLARFFDAMDASEAPNDVELLLAVQIVPDVMKQDASPALRLLDS